MTSRGPTCEAAGRHRPGFAGPRLGARRPAPAESERAPAGLRDDGAFENNIYPSLLLSFGAVLPRILPLPHNRRCATSQPSGALQLRIDSGLFLRPTQGLRRPRRRASLKPRASLELRALRRT
jgi:hypothetical protein